MKPGVYSDTEDTKLAEAEFWRDRGFTFGGWQFLPETGEVRRNGWRVCQLTSAHAEMLAWLIDAHPAYVPISEDRKKLIWGLRRAIGRDAIVAVRTWGYKFNPEAVM